MSSKYKWEAGNAAPTGGLMQITDGSLVSGNDGPQAVPARAQIRGGWGQPQQLHVLGEEEKAVPELLFVTFFSYLEDKFYRGAFPLPHHRIAQLFEEGFPSKLGQGGRSTYNVIVVGVAPGGVVALWLIGAHRQTEVFYGHANEVRLDWHRTLNMPLEVDRQHYIADSLAYAAERDPLVAPSMRRVPIGLWDSYRERFAWKPVFEGIPVPESIGRVEFFSGERDEIWMPLNEADLHATRPVPKFVNFVIESANRSFSATFDEDEVFGLFRRLGADGEPLELVFTQNPIGGNASFRLLLRNRYETADLSKSRYTLFALR